MFRFNNYLAQPSLTLKHAVFLQASNDIILKAIYTSSVPTGSALSLMLHCSKVCTFIHKRANINIFAKIFYYSVQSQKQGLQLLSKSQETIKLLISSLNDFFLLLIS